MKKVIFFIILILIPGCSKKLTIKEDIINISYNDHQIQNEDYQIIINTLESISFYCGKENKNYNNFLTISTADSIMVFSILNNKLGYHQNNQYCYSNNEEKNKNLLLLLDNIIEKYTSDSFYTIELLKEYKENNDDLNIRLDKGNEYIIINLTDYIKDFKINEIELIDKNWTDINLIFSQQEVNNNKIVIRKKLTENTTYKISFTNKYGYTFNIIPTYDNTNKQINFKTEIK